MANLTHRYALIGLAFAGYLAGPMNLAQAQVIPDGTLPTAVNSPDNRNFTIDGGSRSGANLFHSFSQFSLPTGGAAIFNNAADVQNIFSRVTGGAVSSIDGRLQSKGSANLFLLNPNGIIFGPNAQLQIGGSFIGTTASSIKFSDGIAFNAIASGSPLLTLSVPIGLQFGGSPSPIQVNGTGHLLKDTNLFAPVTRPTAPTGLPILPSGLRVNAGKTLALVGGNVNLNGGFLSAFGGRIDVGAAQGDSLVKLMPDVLGWQLGYPSIGGPLGDIRLENKALVDVSGIPLLTATGLLKPSSGSIQLQGRNVSVMSGSAILSQNTGDKAAGQIRVNAIDTLTINSTASDRNFVSRIQSEALGQGTGGNLDLQSNRLAMSAGGLLRAVTFTKALGGGITIGATDSVQLLGSGSSPSTNATSIISATFGDGTGGDIQIKTPILGILKTSNLLATTVGRGTSGNITIDATDVTVADTNIAANTSSLIATSTLRSGTAGNLTINTDRLSVLGGGKIGASTLSSGNAGKVTVNATKSVLVSGSVLTNTGTLQHSDISSTGTNADPITAKLLGISNFPTGNANSVTINTPQLTLSNDATISLRNIGSGDGGMLVINADRIFLDNQGFINTKTISGEGGNITLNARDLLMLRHNSLISTNAGNAGNGGDIKINAGFVIGVTGENSDITANAFKGRGGSIDITTQGLFGLQFRPQITPESDITASSDFGINGNVQVNTIGVDPNSGLVTLPVEPIDPSQKIATGCGSAQNSSFIVTGRGGTASDPSQIVTSARTWSDLRAMTGTEPRSTVVVQPNAIEATALQTNSQGQTELIAMEGMASIKPNSKMATCTKPAN